MVLLLTLVIPPPLLPLKLLLEQVKLLQPPLPQNTVSHLPKLSLLLLAHLAVEPLLLWLIIEP